MRICRFNEDRLGVVEGDEILDVSEAATVLPVLRWPLPRGDLLIANLPRVMEEIEHLRAGARRVPLSSVRLLSPVANPTKIAAAPVNYLKHLQEAEADAETFARHHVRKIEEVGIFLKASSSLVGPGEGVAIRFPDRRNDHEIELAVVIGRTCDRVPAEHALDYVAGYAIAVDMTLRGPEERSMRKSIDSYSVLGPWLVTADEIPDPARLSFELGVNGEVRQNANTRDLVIGIPQLIAWCSSFYTLYPGDVLMTGTPEGVGPVAPGDRILASFEGIGRMEVTVRAAE
ncbi:fumarylacetoacetate hydrolase family protein [Arenibaculum pallidiluteum]|uniref:fumarylacetoacetate hydrolase family protein n=1 Tax=Arenibaculum pallidiluteum TaxID=2812559 RepID=UPI001A9763CA|nr:fumarylacetoacetate hydrolase family protein [Arenibaculum pallidiluteum]